MNDFQLEQLLKSAATRAKPSIPKAFQCELAKKADERRIVQGFAEIRDIQHLNAEPFGFAPNIDHGKK